jgi:hypothetical protein
MLERAEFWYSRLNLLHAITLRAAHSGLPRGTQKVTDLLVGEQDSPGDRREQRLRRLHPFLRVAAELCDEALRKVKEAKDPKEVERYVWEDEGELVSGSPGDLVLEATQLVGDIVVLLNMNEIGDAQEREDFGRSNELPHCMQGSRDRNELFEGCIGADGADGKDGADRCKFRLCPYQPAINRLSAHREISSSFCLHQRRNARAGVARRWGSRVETHALREFWGDLESKARI